MDLSFISNNQYISTILTMFFIIYASTIRPDLPPFIRKLYENPIFRILILSLIVYKGNKDPQLSLMIAIAFTVTLNIMSEEEINEGFKQIENFTQFKKQKN
ncbi:hypothetical protein CPAV1605_637 [seawater metagenome]|uniref:Uncharacterized protein n=1 Tax=seawater metagenome TaxID=1561972 RepID=A0A5E8CLS2_9ZZZZ